MNSIPYAQKDDLEVSVCTLLPYHHPSEDERHCLGSKDLEISEEKQKRIRGSSLHQHQKRLIVTFETSIYAVRSVMCNTYYVPRGIVQSGSTTEWL